MNIIEEDSFFYKYHANEIENPISDYNNTFLDERKESKQEFLSQNISEVKTEADDNKAQTEKEPKNINNIDNSDFNLDKIYSINEYEKMDIDKEDDTNFFFAHTNQIPCEIDNKENNNNNNDDWDNLPVIKIPGEKKEEENNNQDSNYNFPQNSEIQNLPGEEIIEENNNFNFNNNEIYFEDQPNINMEEEETTEKGKHTKFSDDNIRRKCKHIILDTFLHYVNLIIRKFYNNNIGKGILEKQLKSLNQKQKSESNITFNQEFLEKTMAEIFSENISGRITNFPPDHNKKLILSLLNEEDPRKRIFFNKLFSLTFLQCLDHFREKKIYPVLNGMTTLSKKLLNYADDKDYYSNIEYYFLNYEGIILKKKPRKKRRDKRKMKSKNN